MHLVAHNAYCVEEAVIGLFEKYRVYRDQYKDVDVQEFFGVYWSLKSKEDMTE